MKLKKILVPNFIFEDELGSFNFHDATILVNLDSQITSSSFNQKTDEFNLSSSEIERMNRESAQRFFNEKYNQILKGNYTLSAKEVNGIRLFLDVNGTELGKLISLDKGTVSKILSDKHKIQQEGMLLIMERMKNELETPGNTQGILEKMSETPTTPLVELNIPSTVVAEWIVRRFAELEECITNLKLQKLLYYAQGIAAGRFNSRLMPENFEAWEHGPVISSIYHSYKTSGNGALSMNPTIDITKIKNDPKALQILNETINVYGKYTAWVLRNKTHCEAPWLETNLDDVIEFQKIQTYFKNSGAF